MTDLYPGVQRGQVGSEAIVVNYIANAAIPIGAPVKWAAAGTGELSPRVTTSTTATDVCVGVVVDGSNRGTYGGVDTSVTNPTQSASAAGQDVQVCNFGRVKVVVDGSTASIALGDPLTFSAVTAGYAAKATTGNFVFGHAMQASSAYGDIIEADVKIEGVL